MIANLAARADLLGWDPTKVRKGSRIVPLLVLLAMAVVFAVLRLPSGRDLLADQFELACVKLRTASEAAAATAPASAAAAPDAPARSGARKQAERKLTGHAVECAKTTEPREAVGALKAKFTSMSSVAIIEDLAVFSADELGGLRGVLRSTGSTLKVLVDDVAVAFRNHTTAGLLAAATAALYSVLPGIAGMIYRRAFWTWFMISFVALLTIRSVVGNLGVVRNQHDADVAAVAGALFVLVVWQLVVLLLAHRLRRHSAKPPAIVSLIRPRAYNGLLGAGLWAVAIAIGVLGWGDKAWEHTPGNGTLVKWNFILLGLPLVYTLLKVSVAWAGNVPKNIVVCLDGTNNTPDQKELGQLAQTNVFKLFRALKSDRPPGPEAGFDAAICKRYKERQIAFYYVGVGNSLDSSAIGQTLGQATGLGAAGIVDRAYLDVMKVYRPGDRIFIFGFSRGAAISRLLARAIHRRGAPKSAWTLRLFGRHWTVWKSRPARGAAGSVPIAVLGCWDTVGAFGIPKKLAGIDFQKLDLFKDLSVPDNVEQAYHLVALDEQRDSFVPTLMEPDPIYPGRIVEVWFSGDHANVGGGWATAKLSDITLDFMLRQVSSGYAFDRSRPPGDEAWGLCLTAVDGTAFPGGDPGRADAVVLDPDVLGQLRQWMSSLYQYDARKLPLHAVVSDSVFQRMTRSEPVYAPQSLFDLNEELQKKRVAVGQAIDQLKETRSLTEEERTRVLEFRDRLQLTRWSQHIEGLRTRRVAPTPAVQLLLAPAGSPAV